MRRLVPAALTAVVSLGLLAPSAPAHAADPPPDTTSLQAGLAGLAKAGGVGIVARVSQGGQTWEGAYGEAAPGVPATPDARFRAGSVTKSVVSVLALQQVQRGRWTLGTTVGDVLPGLGRDWRDVTVRQLLSHTSGAPEFLSVVLAEATTPRALLKALSQRRTDRQLVRAAGTLDWQFAPGSDWGYSNTNYVVAGMMLAKATRTPLAELAEKRVFRKAGMTDSALESRSKVRAPELRETAVAYEKVRDLSSTSPTLFSGAGNLATTTADLDRFQVALVDGTLLAKPQLRQMRRALPQSGEGQYGLGAYRLPDPCDDDGYLIGHDGATFGTQTVSYSTPDGATRVNVSMTGRNLDSTKAKDLKALFAYALGAFAARCGASTAPDAAVDQIAQRAAATHAR